MAASAASSTAPRVSELPPMTRMEPRVFLSPVGSGSCQDRSTSGVTMVGSVLCDSVLGRGIGLLGDLFVLVLEVLDLVERRQSQVAVGIPVVAGERGVG